MLIENLGRTTTGKNLESEAKSVKEERASGKALPLNKERSKKIN
jgi:hypothetical protein